MRPSKRAMYRFPWSLNDNPIGWLEVTDKCNIYCRGCYRLTQTGHKTLDQIKEEIRYLQEWRNCDNISIAGGEPLIHPDILEIIAYIKERGIKPLILTNGVKLWDNMPLLRELKKAGTLGFTFHIDSEQNRPHWKGKTEQDLFDLRLEYAKMVAEVGGMYSSFGCTIYPGNLKMVPEIVRWANQHIDIVNGLVFICFRAAPQDGKFDYTAGGKKLENVGISYTSDDSSEIYVTSADVYEKIKEGNPYYEPSGYLGGTQTHDAVKWMDAVQFGTKGQMYGSLGPRGMELVQTAYHFFFKHYLAYTKMSVLPKAAFLLSPLDKGIGQAHRRYWADIVRKPWRAFQRVRTQSIAIIQAPDMLPDGRQDMCDSCPDMTFWDGKLVHSCRLDEWRLYGSYMVAQPHQQPQQAAAQPLIMPSDIKEAAPVERQN